MTGEGSAADWVAKVRIAQDAWAWGKRMGYPLIRPGLECRESTDAIEP
ncbi:hypothetical protein [Mycobacteroides abscessus]|nr:hypothetical protein [Mycobacteroides abscessus]SIE24314.1 Uncharacterised protein [Mycobacteroides abscessus subsp. abscessus]